MPRRTMSLDAFVKTFLRAMPRNIDEDGYAYTLILGAGASVSAGIPAAGQMMTLLRTYAATLGISLEGEPDGAGKWSWLCQTVLRSIPSDGYAMDSQRQFFTAAMDRARNEPNLTHLLAAHLATSGLCNPIVTTNFDNLLPAAFSSLPFGRRSHEPHLLYNPRTSSNDPPDIAAGVPIVLKAHGHHTTYGLGVIDEEIAALAPHVVSTLRHLPNPRRGYMVVGYSGLLADGVIDTLVKFKGKTKRAVYWFHVGDEPHTAQIARIAEASDLRMIQIGSSDTFFLRLFQELHQDEEALNPTLFEYSQLVGEGHSLPPTGGAAFPAWYEFPRELRVVRDELPSHPALVSLRKDAIPLLQRIDEEDQRLLAGDCAPGVLRTAYPRSHGMAGHAEQELSRRFPLSRGWTRRNRELLRIALTPSPWVDGLLPFTLLHALTSWNPPAVTPAAGT